MGQGSKTLSVEAATVLINDDRRVQCMVISESPNGAQLGLSAQVELPRRFALLTLGEQREVRLDWQLGLVAEVLFDTHATRLERLAHWFQPRWKSRLDRTDSNTNPSDQLRTSRERRLSARVKRDHAGALLRRTMMLVSSSTLS